MDPFTQRMLQRAKVRREKLENHFTNVQESQSITSPETHGISKGICSDTEFGVKDKNDKHCLTSLGKMKLQKLAQLYTETNENLILPEGKPEKGSTDSSKKIQFKSNKLAELTAKINQWEDENSNNSKQHINTVKKVFNHVTNENVKQFGENAIIWNPPMLEKLRSQGFSLSEKQSKLIYDFKESQKKQKLMHLKCNELSCKTEVCQNASNLQQQNVKTKSSDSFHQNPETNKFAILKYNNTAEPKILEKDPAELTLAERKALFERNKNDDSRLNQNFINLKSSRLNSGKNSETSTFETFYSNKKENKTTKDENYLSLAEKENFNFRSISKNSYEQNFSLNKDTNFENEKIKKEKENESSEVNLAESSTMSSVVNDEQDILKFMNDLDSSNIVSKLPSGRLYPSLDNLKSDDCILEHDASESKTLNERGFYVETNSKNSSVIIDNNSPKLSADYSFSKSKEFQVLNRMDILLENALNNTSSNNENILELSLPSPPKLSKNLYCEFSTNKTSPLLHTISFYRKQQQISATLQDELNENEREPLKFKEDQAALVEDKIQFLVSEVNKQQTIMSQASQALNLCLSTVEFSGSGEQVEGERLLLLASHKRQACLNEIQRLKIDKSLQSYEEKNFEKGDVILSNITIKLKRDALRAMAVAESLQYFVCLVKSEERVLATPVVPALRENLKDLNLQFPGMLKLEGLLSDFKVSIEVYNLELNKEILPHDIKYHIANKKDKKLLTPIKSKKSESKLIKPQIQSPAGPNAIRTSNFQMCGYIVFSLRELNRTQWTLNKVPYMSSLDGSISMTIESQLHLDDEHRGFLTMFEDISGFGAWHRRWCLLSSHIISFWKYPDDEQKKIPIGSIDLRSVTTENVGLVSRDICARLYTFLLESKRPRLDEDRNSLVLSVEDNATIIRQLLSADSKKDMMIWCKKINATLALLRSWKCNID